MHRITFPLYVCTVIKTEQLTIKIHTMKKINTQLLFSLLFLGLILSGIAAIAIIGYNSDAENTNKIEYNYQYRSIYNK